MRNLNVMALAALAATLATMGTAFAGAPTQPLSVPEPSSILLFASAIGGLAWVKFRRRK